MEGITNDQAHRLAEEALAKSKAEDHIKFQNILDHTINHNSNRAYKTYYLCQKFRNFIPEIKRLGLPKFSTEIPWRSEKDMTMIKNLAKDLEKEWKVDLLLILPHVT